MVRSGLLVSITSALVAVGVTSFAYGWRATPCSDVASCAQGVPAAYPQRVHAFLAFGLGVVLVREGSLLLVSLVDRLCCRGSTWRLLDQGLSQLLLCLVLTSLTFSEAHLARTSSPWVHVGYSSPVYTIRYATWIVDVPLLLLLTCCGALRRPLSEALAPILATESYILVSWAVLFLESPGLRWLLIASTFLTYAWASERMMKWVSAFLKETSEDAPCRSARVASVLLLIAVFGVYGVVYLAAASGFMDYSTEMLCYTLMGFGAKVALSILFASIRAYENHQALARLVTKFRGTSVAFVSLLRGSFDHVVPCCVTAAGLCQLPAKSSRDMLELEHLLGRPLVGASFSDQLTSCRERERFQTYVQNALRQHADLLRSGSRAGAVLDSTSQPPVAQALHVRLLKTTAQQDEPHKVPDDSVRVMVHLSMAPQEELTDGPQQAVLALQLLTQEESSCDLKEVKHSSHVKEAPEEGQRLACVSDAVYQDWASGADEVSVEGHVGNGVRLSSSGTMYSTKNSADTTASGRDEALGTASCRKSSGKNISHRRHARTAKLLVRVLNRRIRRVRRERTSAEVRERSQNGQMEPDACSDASSRQKVSFVCGGSEVGSQTSRQSCVNSVVLACRQLLGPLHDELPPAQYISKRIEDHVTCSAEMVKLKTCSEITRHCYNQRLAEWADRADSYRTSVTLEKGKPPAESIPEQIWRSEVLANLQAPHPGPRPAELKLPNEEDLWHKAWQRTYESDSESEAEGA